MLGVGSWVWFRRNARTITTGKVEQVDRVNEIALVSGRRIWSPYRRWISIEALHPYPELEGLPSLT